MIRANVDQKFFLKFLLVFLGCLAFSSWCLWDAIITYPNQVVIAEAYESIPDDDNRRAAWRELAESKGWPTITPQKSAEDYRHLIGQQFLMIVLCGLIGIPALLKWMSGQGTWVEGDETLLKNSKGQEVPIESITKIDKRKWQAKGIAKIHYEVDGKKKKFKMDDFQYDRETMGQLMLFAEANLTTDQIEGGQLERDRIAAQQEAAAKEDTAIEQAASSESEEPSKDSVENG